MLPCKIPNYDHPEKLGDSMSLSSLRSFTMLSVMLAAPFVADAASDTYSWHAYYNGNWPSYLGWADDDDAHFDQDAFDVPADGSHPATFQQHYWQSRGNVFGSGCVDPDDSTECHAHRNAVDYARTWAKASIPLCTNLPSKVRDKSSARQEKYLMVRMYTTLSKNVWISRDDSADEVWKRDRALNRWCPGLRQHNTDDVTFR
jgi:hypothetical protein